MMNKSDILTGEELISNIRSARIHRSFAIEDDTNFSWTESKIYVPFNIYNKIKTAWLDDSRYVVNYYDIYTETLYLGQWRYTDE